MRKTGLAGVVVLGFVLWLYRDPLGRLLTERPFRVRHRNTEFDVGHPGETRGATATTGEVQAAPPPDQDDESDAHLVTRDEDADEDGDEDEPHVDEVEAPTPSKRDLINIAIAQGQLAEGERLFRELEAELADETERIELEASYYFMRFAWGGDPDALPRLEAILQELPTEGSDVRPLVLRLLGQAYERFGNPDSALSMFEQAVSTPPNEREETLALTGLARVLSTLGRSEEAIARLSDALGRLGDRDLQRQLYAALGDLLKAQGQPELQAFVLDKLVELRPRDSSRLFSAAYAYSQVGLQDLALVHYLDLLSVDGDNATALNNVGVAYENLTLPIHSIQRYRQSADLGETLAMANIAKRLIAAGFADDARQVLKTAAEADEVHPNVGSHIAWLANQETQEAEREEQLIDDAKKKRRFVRAFASARFEGARSAGSLAGTWLFPDLTEIEIGEKDDGFVGIWMKGNKKMRLSGRIVNRSMTWTRAVWEVKNWAKTPLEYEFVDKAHGYGIASPTGDSVELFEKDNVAEPFSVLKRKTADE